MLTKIKKWIGITDSEKDDILQEIIDATEQRLISKLDGATVVPKKLEYIIVEVSIMKYNRRGDEGLKSYGQTGHSMTYTDDYFKEYENDIELWNKKNGSSMRGKVVWG